MEICVCGPQVPFMSGGGEQLLDNLVAALRDTGHDAELVRLPTAWDKARIFDAAMAWRLVPLDVEMVIATNFPSYYVRHPNKVVWTFHQHRAAYDGAGSDWSDFVDDEPSRDAQRLLAQWDAVALGEAKRLFTGSGVVSARLAHYNGLASTPLHHPEPHAERLVPGPFGDYFFCPTRHEANKRPGLMVDALAHMDPALSMRIAGRGSLTESMVASATAAGTVDRLELPGFVDDDQLVEHYAGALGVIYPPYDEDYGYVTLQAFRAGKPVITAKDSGGTLEWVEDGVTGFVTDGTPEAIAEAANRLHADRALAEKMGAAGRERVAQLSWDNVVNALVGAR